MRRSHDGLSSANSSVQIVVNLNWLIIFVWPVDITIREVITKSNLESEEESNSDD